MNFNDPFNRVCNQQQSEYLAFRDALQRSQVDSLSSAEALLADIKKRACKFISAIALIVSLISLLFPEAAIASLVFGIVIALWLITNGLKGQRYVKRYINEEIIKQ